MANDTTVSQGLGNGLAFENIDTNKTLTLADCGVVQNVIADGITITLPATAAGSTFYIRNGGVPASTALGAGTGSDGSVALTIAPASVDKIQGLAFTAADNKAAINTKATARVGDYLHIVGDGIDGYNVLSARGTWARQA